jgi:hypothetical protein
MDSHYRDVDELQKERDALSHRVGELEDKLAKVEYYVTFKTSTFPHSKSVDCKYALVLDSREVKAWFDGLEDMFLSEDAKLTRDMLWSMYGKGK